MKELSYDLAIVGAGCAGMAAAIAACDSGVRRIALIERGPELGGVLRQCIHNGFGVHHFGEDLTGVEYASRFAAEVRRRPVDVFLSTTVLELDGGAERTGHTLTAARCGELLRLRAGAVILATGCRERPRGALLLPGTRPAGVMTAGTAQRYLNLEGYLVGRRIVILGSGDIGLIMARQFVLEGAEVLAVCEVMPYSSGLARNIVQCLEDFDIPLYFSTTVTQIHGDKRVTGVTIAKVDEKRRPVPGTEQTIACDSLILSVGLIPENELAIQAGIGLDPATNGAPVDGRLETERDGIFACGNALHVHDLADFAAMEGSHAGACAAEYLLQGGRTRRCRSVRAGNGVRGLVPQKLDSSQAEEVRLQFRPDKRYTDCTVVAACGGAPFCRIKKPILTPGEMCTITLPEVPAEGEITVFVEAGV